MRLVSCLIDTHCHGYALLFSESIEREPPLPQAEYTDVRSYAREGHDVALRVWGESKCPELSGASVQAAGGGLIVIVQRDVVDQFPGAGLTDQFVDDVSFAAGQLLNDVLARAADCFIRAMDSASEHQNEDGIG